MCLVLREHHERRYNRYDNEKDQGVKNTCKDNRY